MSGAPIFEPFDTATTRSDAPDENRALQAQTESARLEAYEAGYRAGWEDSRAADAAASERLKAELARNIESLGFTYHEVRSLMAREARSLIKELLRVILPRAAPQIVAARLLGEIEAQVDAALDLPVVVQVSPDAEAIVRNHFPETPGLPVRLEVEPTLAEGQAYLRFGDRETKLDLTGVLAALLDALEPERQQDMSAIEEDNRA